ncbi:MAG: lytic transglycosylase domain-containing protein [Rhodospirillales bacterium]|nr:lytic transglycosylase domain-containing protein [Rhodospirillales bacterium]
MRAPIATIVLAGLFFTTGASAAAAHDRDIVTEARSHLRLVVALFGGQADRNRARPSQADLDGIIAMTSQRYGIKKSFIKAVVRCESNFDPLAVSKKGARGLMQIMPATGLELGVDPDALWHPETNLDVGVRYLKWLGARHKFKMNPILVSYNFGLSNNQSRRPLPRETKNFIRCVRRHNRIYSRQEKDGAK